MAEGFDEAAIRAELQAWWDDQVVNSDDPFANPKVPAGTIFDVVPVVDSFSVTTALVAIEKHVGFKVPPRIIQRGGYDSFDEMVNDLVPKVGFLFEKKTKPGKGSQ